MYLPVRRNADVDLRELERRWKESGAPEDYQAWMRARARAGDPLAAQVLEADRQVAFAVSDRHMPTPLFPEASRWRDLFLEEAPRSDVNYVEIPAELAEGMRQGRYRHWNWRLVQEYVTSQTGIPLAAYVRGSGPGPGEVRAQLGIAPDTNVVTVTTYHDPPPGWQHEWWGYDDRIGECAIPRPNPPVRRNMDVRIRELERAAASGDVEAAERLIWESARTGTWFLPRSWRHPGGSGPPYASRLNERRAVWVRLLGYLGWPLTSQLQATVAAQAPPLETIVAPGGGEWTESPGAAQLLGQARAFSRIGPKIAGGIGLEVMSVLGEAAAEVALGVSAAQVSPGVRDAYIAQFWGQPMATARELQQLNAAFRRGDIPYEEFIAQTRPLEAVLYAMQRSIRTELRYTHRSRSSEEWASSYSREALDDFWGAVTRHPSDRLEAYATVIFNTIYAVGFDCDAERGREAAGPSVFRQRHGWGDRYGARPSRGCVTFANRVVKRAMLGPALLAIAFGLRRWL